MHADGSVVYLTTACATILSCRRVTKRATKENAAHPLPLKLEDKFRTDWFRVKGRQQDLWPYQHDVALLEAESSCDALPIAKSLDHLQVGKDYDTHAPRNGNNERSATLYVCVSCTNVG